MSEIKKTKNGATTKYKGVWNATICVEIRLPQSQ